MQFPPNPNKKLTISVGDSDWFRYPIKTHFITPDDKIDAVIERYVLPFVQPGDIVGLGQKIVSIMQHRIIYKQFLEVGPWAKFLSRFVRKTPAGFSVGNPLKMQMAIELAGLPRILLASFCSTVTKLVGISGVFYRVAGNQINQIDGFYGEAFPQYNDMGILAPNGCDEICDRTKDKYGFSTAIVDINDLGGNIIGISKDLKGKSKTLAAILKDNPAGQSKEQTPIILIRKADVPGADRETDND